MVMTWQECSSYLTPAEEEGCETGREFRILAFCAAYQVMAVGCIDMVKVFTLADLKDAKYNGGRGPGRWMSSSATFEAIKAW
jgi:hypothetical protein